MSLSIAVGVVVARAPIDDLLGFVFRGDIMSELAPGWMVSIKLSFFTRAAKLLLSSLVVGVIVSKALSITYPATSSQVFVAISNLIVSLLSWVTSLSPPKRNIFSQ